MELVDVADLKSAGAIREGSSPFWPIHTLDWWNWQTR